MEHLHHNNQLQPGSKNISFFQPKFSVNPSNDLYEPAADALAEKVARSKSNKYADNFFKPLTISSIQRKCAECEAEDEDKLQRKEENQTQTETGPAFENYVDGLMNSGSSLPSASKKFFESKMGYDFSDLKIHTDSIAAKFAHSVNALAYTTGNHIVFNQNQFQPETNTGKKLLAHELTHVVQQSGSVNKKSVQRSIENNCNNQTTTVSDPDQRFELLRTNATNMIRIAIRNSEQVQQQPHRASFGRNMLNMAFNCPSAPQLENIHTNLRTLYSTALQLQLSCHDQPADCHSIGHTAHYLSASVCRNFFSLSPEIQLFLFLEFTGVKSGMITFVSSLRSILSRGQSTNSSPITEYATSSSVRTEISFFYNWFIHASAGMIPEANFFEAPPCERVSEPNNENTNPRCSETGRLTGENRYLDNVYEVRHDGRQNFICVNNRRVNLNN